MLSPLPQFNYTSHSPNAASSQLVSFNFLTQVPIEEFVIQEHQKASKMSARLKSNASIKIERELQRKIKEKEQRARLEKVLNNAQLKLKTDVEILRKREEEKRAAVEDRIKNQRRAERIAFRKADQRRIENDEERKRRLEEVQKNRMDFIKKNADKAKEKMGKVEEFRSRLVSEERQKI